MTSTPTTVDTNEDVAQTQLLLALDQKFNTNYMHSDKDETAEIFYSTTQGEGKYSNVYCIRLSKDHDAGKHCPIVRKKSKTHTTGRTTYWVNIKSNLVVCKCWSSKCITRNDGKYTLVEAEYETSCEDSDYESSDDESTTNNKRRRI